ncbi:MAG: hypothetical protein JNK05_05375 [Myxococcales bacterium]|nr:hypothetical protein [Myxococcales bacterium]
MQTQYKSLQKALAQQAKEQEREYARLQAEAYQSRIEVLRSVHADCSTPVDWSQLMWTTPAPEPVMDSSRVMAAQAELDAYQPGFIERTFGGAKAKRAQLEAMVAAEEAHARTRHAHAMTQWEQSVALLRWQQRVGSGVFRCTVHRTHAQRARLAVPTGSSPAVVHRTRRRDRVPRLRASLLSASTA